MVAEWSEFLRQRFQTAGTHPGTRTKLFFSLTIKRTRPVSEVVKKHNFSKRDQVDETDLVVGLGVEKVGNHWFSRPTFSTQMVVGSFVQNHAKSQTFSLRF